MEVSIYFFFFLYLYCEIRKRFHPSNFIYIRVGCCQNWETECEKVLQKWFAVYTSLKMVNMAQSASNSEHYVHHSSNDSLPLIAVIAHSFSQPLTSSRNRKSWHRLPITQAHPPLWPCKWIPLLHTTTRLPPLGFSSLIIREPMIATFLPKRKHKSFRTGKSVTQKLPTPKTWSNEKILYCCLLILITDFLSWMSLLTPIITSST